MEGNVRYNAIIRAVEKGFIQTAKYLLEVNETFGNRDAGRWQESPLGWSMFFDYVPMVKMIICTRTPINPIFTFLTRSSQNRREQLKILRLIDTHYQLAKVIQNDFKQVRESGNFNDETVRKNLSILYDYCATKDESFMLKIFGQSYSLSNPICWRYKDGKYFKWLARTMIEWQFNEGKCFIKNI